MKQAFEANNENILSFADRLEIGNLLLEFFTAVDTKNPAALRDIFASGASICNAHYSELEALLQHIEFGVETVSPALRTGRQQVFNADIAASGNSASVTSYCYGPQQGLTEGKMRALRSVDELQRTAKGWRIVAHVSHSFMATAVTAGCQSTPQ